MRATLRLFALAILASGCADESAVAPQAGDADPATLLAEARGGRSGTVVPEATGPVMVLFKGAPPADLVSYVEALGGTVDFQHRVGVASVRGLDAAGARALSGHKAVMAVADDVSYVLDDAAVGPARVRPGGVSGASALDPSSAPLFEYQWHLGAIGAPVAWAAGKLGSPDVTVAILDTGIDYLHPDLVGRVDLGRSVSFISTDDQYAALLYPSRNPITDLHYHGTHVAATVASNAEVAAGVTSRTTLMAVRVCTFLTDPPTCSSVAVLQGILHAVDQGADVINLSLGGAFSKAGEGAFTSIIQRVLNYANQRGVTIVVAAGNAGRNMDRDGGLFSAYCDGVHTLCVSATGPSDAGDPGSYDDPAFYTNFGRSSVSVAAPGGTSEGAVWAACSTSTPYAPFCADGTWALGLGGTSMAAPHVAGLAALLVAEVGRNPAQIRARILKGAVDLGQRGTDPYYGRGRIYIPASLGIN